ncbi:hypothetical protein [Streptomyces syringium]|uniref:DUF4398 domain-containing protein n=1 Tax=Streptomyces syringium TaxID=76729 RepID=A0ABS4XXX3_9ACTN|nr:hypothetical protein [Streptomyces syringium]MBP2401347.1 hypothetical protein [Streptomyces syringium]
MMGDDKRWLKVGVPVTGVLLAAIGLLYASGIIAPFGKTGYIERADAACAKHRPALAALGPYPRSAGPPVFYAHLQRVAAVMRAAHRDWGKIKVPPGIASSVRDAYASTDTAIRLYEQSVEEARRGDFAKADAYLQDANKQGQLAFTKSRTAGLNVCPAGF